MPTRVEVELEKVYEDLKAVGDKITDQLRTLALGTVALAWLLLTAGTDKPSLPRAIDKRSLVAIVVLAIIGLVCDYLQYVFAYLNSRSVQLKAEAEGRSDTSFDYTAIRYRLRNMLFWLKQMFVIASIAWLIVEIGRSLF